MGAMAGNRVTDSRRALAGDRGMPDLPRRTREDPTASLRRGCTKPTQAGTPLRYASMERQQNQNLSLSTF